MAGDKEQGRTTHDLVTGSDQTKQWRGKDPMVFRSQAVTLDRKLLQVPPSLSAGSKLQIDFFKDVSYVVDIRNVTTDIYGTLSLSGRIEGCKFDTLVLSASKDGVIAQLQDYKKSMEYELRWQGRTCYSLELDPKKRPRSNCLGPRVPDIEDGEADTVPAAEEEGLDGSPESIALADGTPTTIDVLIAYDSTAGTWASSGSGINTYAAQAIAKANTALGNSNIALTYRLVGVCPAGYTYSGSFYTDLDRLTYFQGANDPDGHMDALHTTRDQVGADLVTLWVDTGSAFGTTGLGWVLSNPTGSPTRAFTVCSIQAVDNGQTMTHEFGHNLSCGHANASQVNTAQISPGPGPLYTYSSGYHFNGNPSTTKYHTIMAYNWDGYGNTYQPCHLF
jgi:hypothetical protein